jgi:micrococcal nuclease
MLYSYSGIIEKVIDADTFDILIDLGFNIYKKERVRLARLDTPESRTSNNEEKIVGMSLKKKIEELILNKKVYLTTEKKENNHEKYGRYLADIYLDINDSKSFNDFLLEEGFARSYSGESKKEWEKNQLQNILKKITGV